MLKCEILPQNHLSSSNPYHPDKSQNTTLRGGPIVWGWDFHVGGSQVRNPLPAKARGLPSGLGSSRQDCLVRVTSPVWFASYCSSRRACLVQVTSPVWFASYCIGVGVLPCAHPKGSGCRFPLSSKSPKILYGLEDYHGVLFLLQGHLLARTIYVQDGVFKQLQKSPSRLLK